jgi:hypothetical protein
MVTGRIIINLYDGTRKLFPNGTQALVTITDGNKQVVFRDFVQGPTIIKDVPFYDNLRDQYTVVASVDGFETAGFFPVRVSPKIDRPVFLMLLPRKPEFAFAGAQWTDLPQDLRTLLTRGAKDAAAAQRYTSLIEQAPDRPKLACLLNITTAMRDIDLIEGTALSYFRQLIWDGEFAPRQDRFFAYADRTLIKQVTLAAAQGAWAQEPSPGLLHPGATLSYKQVQFGEANVQLTFHENRPINATVPDGENWVFVEPDIDYFTDLVAHTILEVIPGFFSLTDPKEVYVLRWIAGHQANVAEFNPLYTIRQAAG